MEPEKPENQAENPAPTPEPQPQPEMPVTPPAEPTTPPPAPMSAPMTGPVVGGSSMPVMASAPAAGGGMFKNKNILLAVIVGALLVLAGGAYAVYAYVTNTPDYMVSQAVSQFQVNPMAAKLKVTTNQGGTEVSFNGDFASQTDSTNPKNGEFVLGLGTGSSRISLTAEIFDEALYFKFGDLQNLGGLAQSFGGDASSIYGSPEFLSYISKLNDKWWTVSKEQLQAIAKSAATDAPISGNVSADDFKQLVAVYNQHQFLRPDKVLTDQVIDGVNTGHYTLKVDKDTYKAFLTALKAANLKTFQVTDQDIKDAETNMPKAGDPTLDFWVARDTKKLKQLQVSSTESGNTTTITLTFVTNLPKLDKIQKPADALPITQLMETLLGPSASGLMDSGF